METYEFPGKESKISWVPIGHTCNPSYSGGRDQEDHGLKLAWASFSQDTISKKKKKNHKKGLVEWPEV
jgi:hypothetical protein